MSELAHADEEILAEIVEGQDSQVQLTPEEAQVLTGQIRQTLDVATGLMIVAYRRRAWVALGYKSWDDYCDTEFGALQIKPPKEQRLAQILQLRTEGGMSVRAIAAATGLSHGTVGADLAKVAGTVRETTVQNWTVDNQTVDSSTIQGLNGKSYAPAAPRREYEDLPASWAPQQDTRPEKVASPWIDEPLNADLAAMSPDSVGISVLNTFTESTQKRKLTVDEALSRLTRKDQKGSIITETMRLVSVLVEEQLGTEAKIELVIEGESSNPRVDAVEDLMALLLLVSKALSFFELEPVASALRQQWTQDLQDATDYLGGVLDELN